MTPKLLHVLHNNNQQSHYDCTRGWKIDAASRTLVIHKPGGRWHIPLDNVVFIEIEYAAGEQSREPIDLPLNKRNLQIEVELKTALEDLKHFKDALEHLIDGWLIAKTDQAKFSATEEEEPVRWVGNHSQACATSDNPTCICGQGRGQ